jgi:hypothetical protein
MSSFFDLGFDALVGFLVFPVFVTVISGETEPLNRIDFSLLKNLEIIYLDK